MQKFGFILMIAGGAMVMATIEGGGFAVGFFGFIVAIIGYFIEKEGH